MAQLRHYQETAVGNGVAAHRTGHSRVLLPLPCGTGKTFTTQRLTEEVTELVEAPLWCVAEPRIQLIAQTLKAWRRETRRPFTAVAICSDKRISDDDVPDALAELADQVTVTTDPEEAAEAICAGQARGPVLVLTTYASLPVLEEVLVLVGRLNVFVLDEAHGTAGVKDKAWSMALDQERIPADFRISATATPKMVQADPNGGDPVPVFSMDSHEAYGPSISEYSWRDAIRDGYLSPYEVLVYAVTSSEVQAFIEQTPQGELEDGTYLDVEMAAAQIALARAAREKGIRSVLAFHNRIEQSVEFTAQFSRVMDLLDPSQRPEEDVLCLHVDGTKSHEQRSAALSLLGNPPEGKWVVVSNCQVFNEGIDSPAIDAAMFVQHRSGHGPITQAAGRVMRPNGRKAYILLAVVVPDPETSMVSAETAITASAFAPVYQVLTALAESDDLMYECLARMRQMGPMSPQDMEEASGGLVRIMLPDSIPAMMARHITTHVVERTTSSWFTLLAKTREFFRQHGHVHPRATQTFGGFQIGQRLRSLRRQHASGRLDRRVVRAFEGLGPWWEWTIAIPKSRPSEDEQALDAIGRYLAKYPGAEIHRWTRFPTSDGVDFPIGIWVGKIPHRRVAERTLSRLRELVPGTVK
ncbi:DEAD/DEAH box helicase family protein [Kitasatospora sp. NPDC056076]|uniref:DEAD/DEAH box helicase n=1 Tax=Kitasatospora sp. NPDC056076 TaxID=3345703 RepID=UPI0035D6A94E